MFSATVRTRAWLLRLLLLLIAILVQNAAASANATASNATVAAPLHSSDNLTTTISSSTPRNLPTTTSANDVVLSCDREWASYAQSSLVAYKPIYESTVTKVVVSTETLYQTKYTCSSTCGDVCYADVTTTASSVSSSAITRVDVLTEWASYNGTQPSCTVPSESCSSIWQAWSASTSVWNTWYNNMGPPESEPPWPSGTPGCKWCSTTACYIQGSGKLQLYYWPSPTTATRDMCTDSPGKSHYDPWQSGNYFNTSYTPTTTGSSAVVDGRTFYQGNVYLYIPAASVTNNCQSAVGKVHSDIMLTVAPSDIYTARNDRLGIYPVDYADFNDPVPWSAYKGALQDCASGMNFKPGPWCTKSVVFQEQFHPILNLPISMQHVDPEWAGCKPVMALMDPPVALSAAQLFSTLTTVNPPVETPPQPVDSPTIAATQTRNLDSNGNPDRPGMSGPGKLPEAHTSSGQYVPTPVVTIGPTIISADLTGGVVVDPGITVSKGVATTVSGTAIVVDNNGVTISSPAGSTVISLDQGQVEPLTIASQLFTIDGNDNLVAVPTQLNQADLPVTIDGSIVSIGDTAITILDPQTGKIQTVAFGAAIGADQITLGSETLTLDSSGALVLGPGKTLHVGDAAMTVLGTVISIGEGGITMTEVGIGTSSGTGATSAAGGRGQVQDAVPTESKKGGAERWAVRAGWMIALIITPCMITMA